MIKRSIWLICLWGGVAGHSQNCGIGYVIAGRFLSTTFPFDSRNEGIGFTDKLEYTLSPNCLVLVNWIHDGRASSIDLSQSLRYQYCLSSGDKFRLSGLFLHTLGFQHYFDSLTRVGTDDNSLSVKLDIRVSRQISFVLLSLFTTRLLRNYDYFVNDSGSTRKVLNSSFLTPAVLNLSCGFGYSVKKVGSINLGISSARFTYLHNRKIFSIRDITTYYGIEKHTNSLLEYGLLLQVIIDRDLRKRVHWDCDLRLFRSYGSPPIDFSMKNNLGFRINRFLKINLQTKLLYEERISRHLMVENLFSIGFSVQM